VADISSKTNRVKHLISSPPQHLCVFLKFRWVAAAQTPPIWVWAYGRKIFPVILGNIIYDILLLVTVVAYML